MTEQQRQPTGGLGDLAGCKQREPTEWQVRLQRILAGGQWSWAADRWRH